MNASRVIVGESLILTGETSEEKKRERGKVRKTHAFHFACLHEGHELVPHPVDEKGRK